MHIPGKSVPPHVMYLAVVVFSSLFTSSLSVSVSQEDKKWLLDTLLSLRNDLRHSPSPTFTPPKWDVPGPAPIPTPTQWIPPDSYAYQPNSQALPSSIQPMVHNSKRNYQLGRLSSFGLLCCNHPPTRPPRMKRPNSQDNRLRRLMLLFNSLHDRTLDSESDRGDVEEPADDLHRPYSSYFQDESDSSQQQVQRRGVTVVKSGVSGINTG